MDSVFPFLNLGGDLPVFRRLVATMPQSKSGNAEVKTDRGSGLNVLHFKVYKT